MASENYFTARDLFRRAAAAVVAKQSACPIRANGPNGKELTIDIVQVGTSEPSRAVVASSGLHGVEGFIGSAIQRAWLESLTSSERRLPAGTAVVLVHALNPYGFAWRRRVNEGNVDLNRNFLLPGEEYNGAPSETRALDWFINPGTPPPRFSLFLSQAVFLILRYGMKALKAALTQGQYEFHDGLFFGGKRPEETTALVQRQFSSWVGRAPHVLHLDFHSGLGRFSECRLLSVEPSDSPRGRWLAERFGQGRVEPIGAGVARSTVRGTMGNWLNATLNGEGRSYAFLAPEFGTFSGIRVFETLREENRVHRHPGHRVYEQIKGRLVEAFYPASSAWRETVLREGLALIDRAIEVCQDDNWEMSGTPSPVAAPD